MIVYTEKVKIIALDKESISPFLDLSLNYENMGNKPYMKLYEVIIMLVLSINLEKVSYGASNSIFSLLFSYEKSLKINIMINIAMAIT